MHPTQLDTDVRAPELDRGDDRGRGCGRVEAWQRVRGPTGECLRVCRPRIRERPHIACRRECISIPGIGGERALGMALPRGEARYRDGRVPEGPGMPQPIGVPHRLFGDRIALRELPELGEADAQVGARVDQRETRDPDPLAHDALVGVAEEAAVMLGARHEVAGLMTQDPEEHQERRCERRIPELAGDRLRLRVRLPRAGVLRATEVNVAEEREDPAEPRPVLERAREALGHDEVRADLGEVAQRHERVPELDAQIDRRRLAVGGFREAFEGVDRLLEAAGGFALRAAGERVEAGPA